MNEDTRDIIHLFDAFEKAKKFADSQINRGAPQDLRSAFFYQALYAIGIETFGDPLEDHDSFECSMDEESKTLDLSS